MLVSISEGFCLEGLLGAILFSELDMLAADVELVEGCRLVVVESSQRPGRILKLVDMGRTVHPVSEALARRSCTMADERSDNQHGGHCCLIYIHWAHNCVHLI
jgi:hypothetical protein